LTWSDSPWLPRPKFWPAFALKYHRAERIDKSVTYQPSTIVHLTLTGFQQYYESKAPRCELVSILVNEKVVLTDFSTVQHNHLSRAVQIVDNSVTDSGVSTRSPAIQYKKLSIFAQLVDIPLARSKFTITLAESFKTNSLCLPTFSPFEDFQLTLQIYHDHRPTSRPSGFRLVEQPTW